MVLKVTGKEKEEKVVDEGPKDSLGMSMKESTFILPHRMNVFEHITHFGRKNPALMTAFVFVVVSFTYMLASYSRLTFFHFISFVMSSIFMIWIGTAENARFLFRAGSLSLIFLAMMIFIAIS